MADSGLRAPLLVLVLAFGATLAAYIWQQQHAAPDTAKVTPPAPVESPDAAKSTEALKIAEALKTVEAPKPPAPEAKAVESPHFDVVRVEPSGEAVIAGKGEPGAKVELLASGKAVAEAKADSAGNFVILSSGLAPGGYDLTLRQTQDGKAAVDSTQSVAVSIPAKGSGQVVVALSEPGKPTKILPVPPIVPQKPMVLPAPTPPAPPAPAPEVAPPPPTPPPPAAESQTPKVATAPPEPPAAAPSAVVTPPPPPGVAIRSAELENGNGFFASGTAAAGARVRIYLNDTPLAEVVAGSDGQWTVTIKKGLAGGHYTVRADAGSDGAVTSRAEVPFDIPAAMAQAAPAAQPIKAAPAAQPVKAAPAAPPTVTPAPANTSAERGPEPPSAPNPSEVAAIPAPASPSVSVRETAAPSPNPPAPRPDLAAGAPPAPAKPAGATPAAPTKQAEAVPPTPTLPPAGAPLPNANAVIEQVETAVVVPGDNLWNISRARLGHGKRFTQIYAANSSQIRNPRLIYPGQVLVVPPK